MSGPDRPEPAAGPEEEPTPGRRPPRAPRRSPGEARRFPAWLAIPVAAFGGWWAAEWPGALFGAVAGFFLWRARR